MSENEILLRIKTSNNSLQRSSVRRIFERGGPENLRIMKTKRKISSLGSSPFSCPKFGEEQKKKGLHSNLVRFLAQHKSLHRDSVRLCAQTFCPSYKGGGGGGAMPHFCIQFYANYTILATQRGEHSTMPPLNTPPMLPQ